MKILLTTLNSKFIHSSLALRYLKKFCEKDFPQIVTEEYTINNDLDYILGDIYLSEYDLVCFSCYIWNIEETLKLAKNLKKVSKNIKIILGGPEVTYDPFEILKDNEFIDYIVYGEGEVTFKELLNSLIKNQEELSNINGLAYRENNEIYINEERPLIRDLDIIPFPYNDLSELDNRIIYYESSRGCPLSCQYCLSSTINGVRYFSINRIKNDLKRFVDYGVKQVKFVDRTFNAHKKHSLEIMKYLKEIDNGRINFHFEITASLLDEETLDFLSTVRKGLFQFEIGIQSTHNKTLEAIERDVEFEKITTICKKLTDNSNIHIHLDLIAGLPYEDYRRFLKSFDDVYGLQPDKLQMGFLKLLKGSGIRVNREIHGYIFKDSPPYEVLENDYISYRDILKLKGIENIIEIYNNSHNYDYSLKYIINNNFKAPSEFYEGFAEFWEKNNYHRNSHKKEDNYRMLLYYYKELNLENLDIFKEILKFDFVKSFRGSLPDVFEYIEIDNFKDRCHRFLQDEESIHKYLSEFIGQPAKKIIKKVHFEVFKYDILEVINNNTKSIEGEYVYLFNYDLQGNETEKSIYNKVEI